MQTSFSKEEIQAILWCKYLIGFAFVCGDMYWPAPGNEANEGAAEVLQIP